jgi:hypothetical protein
MADFTMNSIGALLSGGGVKAISKRTRLPAGDVAKVMSYGIPILVGGMNRNAATAQGEQSLSDALRYHSGDDVSNVGKFLKGADLKDGKKIIAHVLGGDQEDVVDQISRASGVSKGKTTSILALLAPLLLSLLGGQQNQGGSNFNLSSLLLSMLLGGGMQQQTQQPNLLGSLLGGGQTQPVQQQTQQPNLLGSLLGGGQTQPVQQTQQPNLLGSLLGGGQTQQVQQTQQQPSGSLFSSLFGGGQSQNNDLVLSEKPEQQVNAGQQFNASQQQQSLLSTLLGGGQTQEPAQEESGGFLDGLLNLFR